MAEPSYTYAVLSASDEAKLEEFFSKDWAPHGWKSVSQKTGAAGTLYRTIRKEMTPEEVAESRRLMNAELQECPR